MSVVVRTPPRCLHVKQFHVECLIIQMIQITFPTSKIQQSRHSCANLSWPWCSLLTKVWQLAKDRRILIGLRKNFASEMRKKLSSSHLFYREIFLNRCFVLQNFGIATKSGNIFSGL